MEKGSKIYIAGHNGLVGSAILRKLLTEGYANLITRSHQDLDLTCQEKVQSFFEKERPDHVFMTAAKVEGIHANNSFPANFVQDNLLI